MSEIFTIASVEASDKRLHFTFVELNEEGKPNGYSCRHEVVSSAKEKAELENEILNTGYVGKQIRILNGDQEFEFIVPRFHLANARKVYETIRREEDWSDETEERLLSEIKNYAKTCHEDFFERLDKQAKNEDGIYYVANLGVFMERAKGLDFYTP